MDRPRLAEACAERPWRNRVLVHHVCDHAQRDLMLGGWPSCGHDPEDLQICIQRERWQEHAIAAAAGYPTAFAVGTPRAGMRLISNQHAVGHGLALEDATGKPLDLLGAELCVRTSAYGEPVLRELAATGHHLFLTAEDEARVSQWFSVVKPAYLRRTVRQVTIGDLEALVEARQDRLPDPAAFDGIIDQDRFFVKTIAKGVHGLVDARAEEIGLSLDDALAGLMLRAEPAQPVLVSGPLDLVRDERGTVEVRVQVIDGQPVSLSRYVDYRTAVVPSEVAPFAERFIADHASILPGSYVVDIGMDQAGPVVIELNGWCGSGRYHDNRATDLLAALFGGPHAARVQEELERVTPAIAALDQALQARIIRRSPEELAAERESRLARLLGNADS
jgi:hypothetical protein